MPRVELTLSANYLPAWGIAEGLRELCQNWLDAADDVGEEGSVHYRQGTLRFHNPGAAIDRDALLLGTTSKLGRDDQRGQFGEGLKLGTLALCRQGATVRIESPDEIWTAQIESSDTFAGARVLTFHTRKRPQRGGLKDASEGVTVIVKGIDREAYENMREGFVHFHPPKDCVETTSGTLIRDPGFKGRVYCRGILITINDKLHYGYDLKNLKVDRDRKMVDQWELTWETSTVLNQSLHDDASALLTMLEEQAADVEQAKYRLDGAALDGVVAAFREKYGDDAVPVKSHEESIDLEHFGQRGIPVPEALREVLEKQMESATAVRVRLGQAPAQIYAHADLTVPQRGNLQWAVLQLAAVVAPEPDPTTADRIFERVRIVRFHDPQLRGLHHPGGDIDLDVGLLDDRFETLRVLVHEWAHDQGGDGEKSHVAAIERLWTALARHWVAA